MNPELLAALAGVALHLQEAEEAERAGSIAGGPHGWQGLPGTTGAAPWALHGRQSIMRMRTLVQQRVLKR